MKFMTLELLRSETEELLGLDAFQNTYLERIGM